MTQEEIATRLAKIVHNGGLAEYPLWSKADKLSWQAFFDQIHASISDTIESSVDSEIRELTKMFSESSADHRAAITKLSFTSNSVIHFALRQSTRVLRHVDVEALRDGLLALIMEDVSDYRDTLGALTALIHASQRQNVDFDGMVNSVLHLGTKETQQFFREQLKRDDLNLKSFGLIELTDKNGPYIAFSLDFSPALDSAIPDSELREATDRITYYYLPEDGNESGAANDNVSVPIDPALAQLLASQTICTELPSVNDQDQSRFENEQIIVEPLPAGSDGEGQADSRC